MPLVSPISLTLLRTAWRVNLRALGHPLMTVGLWTLAAIGMGLNAVGPQLHGAAFLPLRQMLLLVVLATSMDAILSYGKPMQPYKLLPFGLPRAALGRLLWTLELIDLKIFAYLGFLLPSLRLLVEADAPGAIKLAAGVAMLALYPLMALISLGTKILRQTYPRSPWIWLWNQVPLALFVAIGIPGLYEQTPIARFDATVGRFTAAAPWLALLGLFVGLMPLLFRLDLWLIGLEDHTQADMQQAQAEEAW